MSTSEWVPVGLRVVEAGDRVRGRHKFSLSPHPGGLQREPSEELRLELGHSGRADVRAGGAGDGSDEAITAQPSLYTALRLLASEDGGVQSGVQVLDRALLVLTGYNLHISNKGKRKQFIVKFD